MFGGRRPEALENKFSGCQKQIVSAHEELQNVEAKNNTLKRDESLAADAIGEQNITGDHQ